MTSLPNQTPLQLPHKQLDVFFMEPATVQVVVTVNKVEPLER